MSSGQSGGRWTATTGPVCRSRQPDSRPLRQPKTGGMAGRAVAGRLSSAAMATLFAQVDGRGDRTVVLLNGVMMTVASWIPVVRRLTAGARVVRMDFRGQWLTAGRPPAEAGEHAADVVETLDGLGVERADLVGTSFGGMIAGVVAARWPERVRSWTAMASPDHFDEAMLAEIERWRRAAAACAGGSDPAVLAELMEEVMYSEGWRRGHGRELRIRKGFFARLPPSWFAGLDGLLRSAPTADLRPLLPDVACPTLVVAASDDGFVPTARVRALAEGVAGARFELLEGAGHGVVIEQPGRVAECVLGWLSELR